MTRMDHMKQLILVGLGVILEGRGPCAINYHPGNPHTVRDNIQPTVRRSNITQGTAD